MKLKTKCFRGYFLKIGVCICGLFFLAKSPKLYAQQNHTISGTVTDAQSEETMPGVNIKVRGTTTGTSTDSKGHYSLNVPSLQDTLVVSFVGYQTLKVPINGQRTVDIEMEPQILQGQEMVVVGYGIEQKKEDLTGSVQSVDITATNESANENLGEALSGKVAGLSVSKTNRPGEEPTLKIRGQTTLEGSRRPLLVLDGVIYKGNITDLNPNSIKSVNVLKGPSAKAIYGAQAANGVVVITTKNGKKNQKPQFDASYQFVTKTPAHKLQPADRDGFLKKARAREFKKVYQAPDYTEEKPGFDLADYASFPFYPAQVPGIQNGTNFDWYGKGTRPSKLMKVNLSASGGSDNTSYYVGGEIMNNDGWIINDKYQRVTGTIRLEQDVNKWLDVGINSFGSFVDKSGQSPNLTDLVRLSPLVKSKNDDGSYIIRPNANYQINPILRSTIDDNEHRNHIRGMVYGDLSIPKVKGLSYRFTFNDDYIWYTHATADQYGASLSGSTDNYFDKTNEITVNNKLTYNRDFNENNSLNATIVYSYRKEDYRQFEGEGQQYDDLTLGYNKQSLAKKKYIYSGAYSEAHLSQSARLNYVFRDKYILTATLRRDGFSGFAENNKIGWFPSAGIAWKLSKEKFLSSIGFLNQLKLRAGYGESGNLTDRYSSLARVNRGPEYVFDGSTALGQSPSTLSNPNLSWETTKEVNIGLDFGVFDNRLSGSLDYYTSKTNNLLWNLSLPIITGFSEIRSNLGEIDNHGFEMSLSSDVIRSSDFNWNMNINFSTNANKLVRLLGNGKDLIADGLFIGEPIGAIYGYQIKGIWQVGETPYPGFETGQYKIVDQNGDGKITAAKDRVILGRTEPAYSFSIQPSFSYKNFSLSMLIKAIRGGKNGYLAAPGGEIGDAEVRIGQNFFRGVDYWTPKNPDARYRLPDNESPVTPHRRMQRNFMRLEDLLFSYTFNQDMLQKANLSNIKLYVSGKNLLTITNWDGWDPETGQGYDLNGLPVMKSFAVGLDVSF